LGAQEVRALEEERVLAFEYPRTNFSTEGIAEAVTHNRSDKAEGDENADIEDTLGRQKPGGEEQAVARKERAQKKSGLGENDECDAEKTNGFDEGLYVEHGLHLPLLVIPDRDRGSRDNNK